MWRIAVWTLIIGLILIHSIRVAYTVDFFAINGTFQNFNPIRRLLAGEFPYKDFTIYLGLGHLFIGSIFTFLFGEDFSGCLVAFSFLTLLAFCLIAISLGKVVLGKTKAVYVTTLSMVAILLVQPLFFTSAGGLFAEIVSAMGAALSPGNSARFIRGMILPLSLLVGMYSLGKINWLAEQQKWSESRYNIVLSIAHRVISRVCFIWSNDYGIACWICSLVVQIMINAKRTKSFAAVTAGVVVQIVISLFTIFAVVEAVTLGNFSEWLHSLFGIGSFQKWYFGTPHYLWDIDLSFLTLLQAVITIFYLGKIMLGNQKELAKYAELAYANMVCYAAVNEYALFNNANQELK